MSIFSNGGDFAFSQDCCQCDFGRGPHNNITTSLSARIVSAIYKRPSQQMLRQLLKEPPLCSSEPFEGSEQSDEGDDCQYFKRKLNEAIVRYISSRRKFDSRYPTDYKCQLQSIEQDEDVRRHFLSYQECQSEHAYEIPLEDFIAESHYLLIDDYNNVSLYEMDSLQILDQASEDSESSSEWDEDFEEKLVERETELQESIDYYIRTRRKFDYLDPLRYKVSLQAISEDIDVKADLANLNEIVQVQLVEFIEKCDAFVWYAARQQVSVRFLTPKREKKIITSRGWEIIIKRFFGQFECKACPRQWNSAFSWVDKWQRCKGCEAMCYPYEQTDLERGDGSNAKARVPHDMERCEMCVELGELCAPYKFYDVRSGQIYDSDGEEEY